ncbi:efflux RND transporter periplasmic adaptor subunit [Rhizobium phaseoli]|uniref:RND family efflux transporter protein n=1 Tax=Rhizobium phaseoli TaxID=396 RepID=A0ABN4QWU2_9HYPH|nr:efflux RND transporter periplasmic adaptor subunit [Rhizobium phaseoli]ANL89083.1 RND family efflux transporter protein [Rhizobium phaseoli]ANL95592.1 RND family efflux transporter protein [Rhizobium phaseoli]KEC71361.1 cation efflux system protein [Rhizobium leguminosarum bv. phaseoli CCGM1]PWI51156.1 efflux transporter periplasmic adaptor subunit [Rhizobium phaseoli]
MRTAGRTGLTLVAMLAAGAGGLWAGQRGVALPDLAWLRSIIGIEGVAVAATATPAASGPIIYYRDPDGRPAYSAVPKKTPDGRDFLAVHASEDLSFEANSAAKPAVARVADNKPAAEPTKGKILYYRNPMGLPDTSKVPKKDSMGMDYIPVYEGEQPDASTVKVSLGKLQRTGVKTVTAEMASISRKVEVPGTVALDERLVSVISMRADSFVDDVANVTTGDRIGKGETLFRFYSRDIAAAASEYAAGLNGARSNDETGSALRLRNFGVPQEVIDGIARTRQVPTSMSYTAPRGGIVLERTATAGMMAKPGEVLFRIADTSDMWVTADVPEYDLASVHVGAKANVTVRSLPGRIFEGTIDLIYPEVDMQTRTTKVRIELPNPDGVLLANMYADVGIEAGAISPVVAVPNSAIVDTGDRQVVFIDKGDGKFEPKDVRLGVRGDDSTEIRQGIAAGDRVVVSANFLLDAESNLNSALSAMTEEAKP